MPCANKDMVREVSDIETAKVNLMKKSVPRKEAHAVDLETNQIMMTPLVSQKEKKVRVSKASLRRERLN